MVPQPDQVIASKYRLVRRLARGGMGSVWLARHLELDTDVALKFLRSDEGGDGKAEARFRREARAAAALKSPHVVRVYDFGVDTGSAYIAMELLHGQDLRSYLEREGRLSVALAKEILLQASKGLRAAHDAGTIHRDIKPSNLFLEDSSGDVQVKVLDFGIAKGPDLDASDLTTQGQVFGSPAYMSPEQARGGQVDVRSDVWSLGAVFFEMLTGSQPFVGATASDLIVKLCTEDPPVPTEVCPELPHEIDLFVRRALHRDVNRRFQNVEDLLAELEMIPNLQNDAPPVTNVGRSAGRTEETAPLPPLSPEGHKTSTFPSWNPLSASRPLRQSLVPARPPKSSVRGVLAVGGVLGLLGLVGLGMRREAPQPLPSSAVTVAAEVESVPARPTPGPAPQGERTPRDQAPTAADPSSPTDGAVAAEALPSEPPQTAKKTPQSERKPPVPSTSRPSPLKPKADPVFGLPVDSP